MELRGLATAFVALALAPAAQAQTAAGEGSAGNTLATDVRPHDPGERPNVGIGARLGGGLAYADGVPDAWLMRLDYELFPFLAPRHAFGGLFGFTVGFDYWHARRGVANNWGLGLPAAFVVGMRAVAVRGYLGVGVNAMTLDQVADDTGLGWMAPMAVANVGLDLFGVNASLDTRVSRRWQFGAPDHTQWMFALMIGATLEPKHNRAFFDGRPGQN